jgi:uncharacterized iron-regulated membrane protein
VAPSASSTSGWGWRSRSSSYPLHAGKTGGAAYRLASFVGALALAILSVNGALSYLRKPAGR